MLYVRLITLFSTHLAIASSIRLGFGWLALSSGGSVIPSHPRHVPSARREPTTRKDGRQRRKERKEIEQKELLGKRKEEIRREREEIERQVAQELAEEHGEMEPVIRKKKGKDNVDSKTGPIPKEEKRKKAKKRKQDDWSGEDGVDVDIMDADVHEECDGLDDEWNDTEEMRKKKVDQYMDEVVSRLGFNDIVRTLRFFYSVVISKTRSTDCRHTHSFSLYTNHPERLWSYAR